MPIVNCEEMLKQAVSEHYAIPQFNINSLEWCKTVLETCESMKSPVILGTAMKAADFMAGYRTVNAMVRAMMEDLSVTVPVALHLDHGNYEACLECVDAGYTSVMFDGSKLPFEDNLLRTRELAKICRNKGISLEAEAGVIGDSGQSMTKESSDEVSGKPGNKNTSGGGFRKRSDGNSAGEYADPEECRKLAEAGITMLAAGIGNIHGTYPADWDGLNWDVLRQIKEKTGVLPLVLHGGSGIPEEMLKKAVSLGTGKININTECQIAFMEGAREYFSQDRDLEPKGYFVRNLFAQGLDRIRPVLAQKIMIFGCAGNG